MLGASLAAGAETEIKLAWIGGADSDARKGVGLGVDEANLQGRFLGYGVRLLDYKNASELKDGHGAAAILTELQGDELEMILVANEGVPVFYIGDDGHSLMPPQCKGNLLSVLPTKDMLGAAGAAWKEAKPDKPADAVAAWHPKFVKFAARDLNKRYLKANDRVMTPTAWGGWAAVKAINSAFASKGTEGMSLLADPERRGELGFDGQKGLKMSFRKDGMLPQVILASKDGKLLGEVPGTWPKADQMHACSGH